MGVEVGFVNAAVLREGFLVGLEAGEELDATEDAFGEGGGQPGGRGHDAVEAEGDRGFAGLHLEVDVAGAGALGLGDEAFENLGGGFAGVRSLSALAWWDV